MCYALTLGHFLYCFTFVFNLVSLCRMTLNSGTSVKASKTGKVLTLHSQCRHNWLLLSLDGERVLTWQQCRAAALHFYNGGENFRAAEMREKGLLWRSTSRVCHRDSWSYDSQMFSSFCTHRLHTCPCIYTSIFIHTIQSYTHTHMEYIHTYIITYKRKEVKKQFLCWYLFYIIYI